MNIRSIRSFRIMLSMLLAVVLLLPTSVALAVSNVNRITTPVPGWQLNTPRENTFQIPGTDKTFIVMDTTNNASSKYFIMAKDSYGIRTFDPDNTTRFDVTDSNNLAYWLNHNLVEADKLGAKLPIKLLPYIDTNHSWLTEGCHPASDCPNEYTVTAGIAVLSQTEFVQYITKFGIMDSITGWGWWLRTARGQNVTTPPTAVLGVPLDSSSRGQTHSNPASYTGPSVRPAFYLSDSFFTSVKLDLLSLGSNVKRVLLANYTRQQLSIYSDSEYAQIQALETINVQVPGASTIMDPQSAAFQVDITLDSMMPSADYTVEYSAPGSGVTYAPVTSSVASGSTKSISVPLTGLKNGNYNAEVQIKKGSTLIRSVTLPFTIMPVYAAPSATSRSPIGFSTHYALDNKSNTKDTDILTRAGISYVRDELLWSKEELTKGTFDFTRHDGWVNDVTSRGIQIIGVLDYSNLLYNGKSADSDGIKFGPKTKAELDAYVNYVSQTVSHYSGKVNTFEIWNEPNLTAFWKPEPNVTDYVQLAKAASVAIRKANPNATIIAGAIANSYGLTFLNDMLEQGLYPYIDAISFHPYIYPESPDVQYEQKIQNYADMLRTSGGWKDLYITEVGYPTSTDIRGVTEQVQAEDMVKLYMKGADVGIKRTAIYDFRNDGLDPAYTENNFGVIRADYTSKPSLVALAELNHEIGAADYAGMADLGSNTYGYVWLNGSQPVVIAYAKSGTQQVTFAGEHVTTTDMYGNVLSGTAQDQAQLGTAPVYINGLSPAWVSHAILGQIRQGYDAFTQSWSAELSAFAAQDAAQALAAGRQLAATLEAAGGTVAYATLVNTWNALGNQGDKLLALSASGAVPLAKVMTMLSDLDRIGTQWGLLAFIAADSPAAGGGTLASTAAINDAKQFVAALSQMADGATLPYANELLRHASEAGSKAAESATAGLGGPQAAWDAKGGLLTGWAETAAELEKPIQSNVLLQAFPSNPVIYMGQSGNVHIAVRNERNTSFQGTVTVLADNGTPLSNPTAVLVDGLGTLPVDLAVSGDDPALASSSKLTIQLQHNDAVVQTTVVPFTLQRLVDVSVVPTDKKLSELSQLQWKLTNQFTAQVSGQLAITAPNGWQLAQTSQPFTLNPAETKTVVFDVVYSADVPFHNYVFQAQVNDSSGQSMGQFRLPLNFNVITKGDQPASTAGTIDLSSWGSAYPVYLNPPADPANESAWQASNAAAKVYTQWDEQGLQMLVQAYDDVQNNTHLGSTIWNGDDVQISLDTLNDKTGAYNGDDYELGFALSGDQLQVYAWNVASGQTVGSRPTDWLRVERSDMTHTTTYLIRIPKTELSPIGLTESSAIGMNIVLNDGDALERERMYEYTPGTALVKNPSLYATWPLKMADDVTSPSAPANLHTTEVGTHSVSLAWNAATDNIGVDHYEVYRNGISLATVTGVTYNVYGLADGTAYLFTVKAVDSAGNRSAASQPLQVTTQLEQDTTLAETLSGPLHVFGGQSLALRYGLHNVATNVYGPIYAQELYLQYDPSQLMFVNAVPLNPDAVGLLIVHDDPVAGTVRIVAASLGMANAITVDGDVFQTNWTVKTVNGPVSAHVSIVNSSVSNGTGNVTRLPEVLHETGILYVDKTALNQLIASARATHTAAVEGEGLGQYPEGSKARLLAAIQAADQVAGTIDASEGDVAAAVTALSTALQTFRDGVITVLLGDLNRNGRYDIGDLGIMAANYGTSSGTADLDYSGNVDITDLVMLAMKL